MSLILLLVLLVFMGVVAYYVRASSKIDPTFKAIIYIVLVVVALILVLQIFGVWSELKNFKVGR